MSAVNNACAKFCIFAAATMFLAMLFYVWQIRTGDPATYEAADNLLRYALLFAASAFGTFSAKCTIEYCAGCYRDAQRDNNHNPHNPNGGNPP